MPDLNAVFTELRSIMAPYAAKLDPKKDNASELYIDTKLIQKNKKPLFFGAGIAYQGGLRQLRGARLCLAGMQATRPAVE